MKPLSTIITLLLGALVLLTGCVTSEQGITPPEQQTQEPAALPESAVTGVLENGLTYYLYPNEHPENRIFLQLAVDAGAVQEDESQRGIAHFVEHMAFNGTRNFSQQALVDYFESIGMAFGDGVNAFTGFQQTVYILEIPGDDPEILTTTLQVLEDWMNGLSFDPQEVEKERGVIMEEWRLGQNAQGRRADFLLPAVLENSKFARRLPIGIPEVIQGVSAEELTSFYDTWYIPTRMAVSIVGSIEPDTMEDQIITAFQDTWTEEELQAQADSPAQAWKDPVQPPYQGIKSFQWGDPEFPYDIVELYGYQKTPDTQDYPTLARQELLNSLTATALSFRLSEAARSSEPPFLGANFATQQLTRGSNLVSYLAIAQGGDLTRALSALLQETAYLELQGIDQAEFQRAKSRIQADLEAALEQAGRTESGQIVGQFTQHFLTNSPYLGPEKQLQTQLETLASISLGDFNAHASQLLSLEHYRLLLSLSEADPQVDTSQLEALVNQRADLVQTATSLETLDTLIPVPPQAGSIVNEELNQETGILTWELSNGMTVLLRPSTETPGEVLFTALSPGGLSLVSEEDYWTALLAPTLLAESGLADFSYSALETYLADKAISLQPYLGDYFEGLSGTTRNAHLEEFIQLIHLQLSQVRSEPGGIQSILSRLRTNIENRDKDPQTIFSDEINRLFADSHPRGEPLSLETLAMVEPQRALSLFQERFYNPGDFTLIFAGDLTPDQLRPLAETYLASLPPGKDRSENARDLGIRAAADEHSLLYRGIEDKGLMFIAYNQDIPLSRTQQLALEALKETASIRLRKEIREDKSASYGVSVSTGHQPVPYPDTWFTVSTGFEPSRREELFQAITEILAGLAKSGPSSEELTTVRQVLIRGLENQDVENSFWLSQMEQSVRTGSPILTPAQLTDRVQALTAQDIQTLAAEIFDQDTSFSVTLLPEQQKP
ncbi:M16 family metallopeptidase [Spirochaeta lutea]|uniref:Peptidase M16 n=1 Tax=Spirochaeta lutea TaxID=1480694 RepID=A0A098QV30_9SPIO|nr:M16 family metallopeptidase [Spirochaeta lutea]KGE71594.1 hypothetical protein DC28_09955 [Spirochaeta lutea]